jgi:hypothetical protein
VHRADSETGHLVAVALLADALEVQQPNVSGNVTSAARMHPQNTSWWASQREVDRADEALRQQVGGDQRIRRLPSWGRPW